jgi:hypothetical protein
MKSKMIVSSKALREALQYVERTGVNDSDESVVSFRNDGAGIEVSGIYITNVMRDWEDFDVDSDKAMKLRALLMAMSEQPITVMYDGNWFTIQEVLV